MRVFNTTPHCFNKEAFARFLKTELVFTEADLHKINIYLSPDRPKKVAARNARASKVTHGHCCYPSIHIYVNGRSLAAVNRTLYHEASHYADHLCLRRALCMAYQRSQEDYQVMLAQILEQRRQNEAIPYFQRPGEIRARMFAELHYANTPIIMAAPALALAQ